MALTACAGSMPTVEAVDPCARPVTIPAAGVSDQLVELLWARDRKALIDCADKVEVLSGRGPVQ